MQIVTMNLNLNFLDCSAGVTEQVKLLQRLQIARRHMHIFYVKFISFLSHLDEMFP